jgi:hypothetical protein
MPPDAEGLVGRLSEWIAVTRDSDLRHRLLDQGLARIRKERRGRFLELLAEWLLPEQSRHWGDAVRAATAAVRDPSFTELPPLLEVLDPALKASPPQFQLDVEELLRALYEVSPSETTYYLRQILMNSENRAITSHFRRMAAALPAELRSTIQECTRRAGPLTG